MATVVPSGSLPQIGSRGAHRPADSARGGAEGARGRAVRRRVVAEAGRAEEEGAQSRWKRGRGRDSPLLPGG